MFQRHSSSDGFVKPFRAKANEALTTQTTVWSKNVWGTYEWLALLPLSLNIACRTQAIRSYLISLCWAKKASKDLQRIKTTECLFPRYRNWVVWWSLRCRYPLLLKRLTTLKIHRKMCVIKCNCSKGANYIPNAYYLL